MWKLSWTPLHCVFSCFVLHSLNNLEEFIKIADKGLSKKVEKGDYDGLVEIMGHLMAVKERHSVTDAMFEPLKQTIELLKTYEQQLPEEVYKQLEVGKNLWWTQKFAKEQMSKTLWVWGIMQEYLRPHSQSLEGLSG